jgi:5-aminopentanamidase
LNTDIATSNLSLEPHPRAEGEPSPAEPSVAIACCQTDPDVESPEATHAALQATLVEAITQGAQIVVLPELATSGYAFASVEEARKRAISLNSPLLQDWAQEARRHQAIIIGGFCELARDGSLYNSAAIVDGDGVRAIYRKLHLWDREVDWFKPGEVRPPVVETKYGRLSMAICHDIEFPEVIRCAALEGADIIAVPTNWPRHSFPAPDRGVPILQSLAASNSYSSRVYVAICDRTGSERGIEFAGRSLITGPDGRLITGPTTRRAPTVLHASCDLAEARDKSTGPLNDAFGDRRSDLYEFSPPQETKLRAYWAPRERRGD